MPNGTPPIKPTQPKPIKLRSATPARKFTPDADAKNKKPATKRWKATLNLISVVLIVLTILGWGLVYFLNQARGRTVANLNAQVQEIKSDLETVSSQRLAAEALAAQLKNEEALLGQHITWSALLNKLSAATPRKVNFTEFAADLEGRVTVSGFAQTMSDLAKLTKSLETSPEFSTVEISGVELTAVQRPDGGTVAVFSFRASFFFEPGALKTSS